MLTASEMNGGKVSHGSLFDTAVTVFTIQYSQFMLRSKTKRAREKNG